MKGKSGEAMSLETEIANALTTPNFRKSDLEQKIMILQAELLTGKMSADVDNLKMLVSAVDKYLSQTRPVVSPEQYLALDRLVSQLLPCVIYITELSHELHVYARDQTDILASLSSLLNNKLRNEDQIHILKSIEVLSRELTIYWSAPYLVQLIKQIHALIVHPDYLKEGLLYGLRILTNLVLYNQCCRNLVVRDAGYKDVMKTIITILATDTNFSEVRAVATHYAYLTEPGVRLRSSIHVTNITSTLTLIQNSLNTKDGDECLRSVAASIHYLTIYVATNLARLSKDYREGLALDASTPQTLELKTVRSQINEIIDAVAKTILSGLINLIPLFRSKRSSTVVEQLLRLVKTAFPACMPIQAYEGSKVAAFIDCIEALNKVTELDTKPLTTSLEVYKHFIDRILTEEKHVIPHEAFKHAFSIATLRHSTSPQDLTRNLLVIRLLTQFNTMTPFQSQLKTRVTNELTNLLKLMMQETLEVSNYNTLPLQLSIAVVESLYLMDKFAECSAVVIESMQTEYTWYHISECISKGDKDVVQRALTIIGRDLSHKCCAGVSESLVAMREVIPCVDVTVPNNNPINCISKNAQLGVKKLSDNLEQLALINTGRIDYAVDDILMWYRLKSDMHEMETADLHEQIVQQNKKIMTLQVLLNKQSDLVAKRVASTAAMQKEQRDMQLQLDQAEDKRNRVELKHAKTMTSLREQLQIRDELTKTTTQEYAIMQNKFADLENRFSALNEAKTQADQVCTQVAAEKQQLEAKLAESIKTNKATEEKISLLEDKLKRSDEARKATEAQLEAERRKTEIIQQILGNRT